MACVKDGPASPLFAPVKFKGNVSFARIGRSDVSAEMAEAVKHAPRGACVFRGIPFAVGSPLLVKKNAVTVKVQPTRAKWFVFMHTSDKRPAGKGKGGFISPMRGEARLGEHAADYVICYEDGTEARAAVRRRFEIGVFSHRWGEQCFESVPHIKPRPVRASHEQTNPMWGQSQTRVAMPDCGPWINWLWAWENPYPKKAVTRLRFEPVSGAVLVSAVSCADVSETPLRWRGRRKAVMKLTRGRRFEPTLDERGLLKQIQLDLGQVISAAPRPIYPNDTWGRTYNNRLPELSKREVLIEYAAHPDARFHLAGGKTVSTVELERKGAGGPVRVVAPSERDVRLRVVEKASRKPVAVKLHVHGEAGEYLAPVDRHRIPNAAWFEDYSVDFAHKGVHYCTYIDGETTIKLPVGRVYVEVSKGFEIRPVRKVVRVTRATKEIAIEIEKVLPWREAGWVSADTHVHFLSPQSALLEGAGEGVNVVNLLASQWGELMTNVGDFDGKTTFGSKEAGGDGEYLVRVGTENRQHVLGHISLLGYGGRIIAPMTTGGPDESAIGDPIGALLTDWARRCRKQDGVVIIPHFPNPRCEHAATIVSGDADGVEMTAWGELYAGIDPYSLSDWYRYLNCGYLVAAVGGTDKMSASTAVGTVRTYARVGPDREFTYEAWKDAIRRAETFVTYGPLLEFAVEGKSAGTWIDVGPRGATVDVTWKVASVTVPVSRVELVVNGEIRESRAVKASGGVGFWSVRLEKSSWLALLVRGHYADKSEIIAAHSSPVMVRVENSPFLAAADAVTILEQIEGAIAYIDTVGTRAEATEYKRMRLILTAAHRRLHNRLHQAGCYHEHSPVEDHAEHH